MKRPKDRAKIFERLVRRIMRQVPLYTEEQTSQEELLRLIRALRPIHSGIELVRIGPDGDGGYLVPDDLAGVEYCFSPGVADIFGFEKALLDSGISSYLADFSVDAPENLEEGLNFDKKYIGLWNDEVYMTMDRWVKSRLPDYDGDLMLQMDVEGAEYEILLNISDEIIRRFRVMVIEFHYLSNLFDKRYFVLASRVFERLTKYFDVVHIHPNNYAPIEKRGGISIPPLMEMTFHRKDRVRSRVVRRDFPHVLDRDNTSNVPVVLPETWFK